MSILRPKIITSTFSSKKEKSKKKDKSKQKKKKTVDIADSSTEGNFSLIDTWKEHFPNYDENAQNPKPNDNVCK